MSENLDDVMRQMAVSLQDDTRVKQAHEHMGFIRNLANSYGELRMSRARAQGFQGKLADFEPQGTFSFENMVLTYIRDANQTLTQNSGTEQDLSFSETQINRLDMLKANFIEQVDKATRPGFLAPAYQKNVHDAVSGVVKSEQARIQNTISLRTRPSN